jgi:signal transduction histidine kinase
MVALASIPALAVGIFTISHAKNSLKESAVQRVEFDTHAKARAVGEFLQGVEQDLRFLAQSKAIQSLANAEITGAVDQLPVLRGAAERELLIFSQGKRAYYQVRYLSGTGQEVVRLDVENGLSRIVPADRLQDKSDRYYFKAALAQEPGQIYVSPMDLNVEYGEPEIPHRSVVRYATRVTGGEGQGGGLVVINLHADYLLSLVGPMDVGADAWLVDREGTYLGYVGESPEKRHRIDPATRRRLSADYGPDVTFVILSERIDKRTVETDESFLSFSKIDYLKGTSGGQWTLVTAHPRGPIERPIRYLAVFLLVVTAFVTAVAGVVGVWVAHYLARPVARLRRATREIAAGDLSKHVEVTTGDEIEGLARDFNTMTDRLREAHGRLSAWNAELEREVAHQTDHLRRLQAGLARVDKLATIGQMTAGVMHEVGNPMAAIKTKIQVAQEEAGGVCDNGNCRTLLSEVLGEVDRLAVFLRSFSRLSRLREPRFDALMVSDIVRDVVVLITPVLKRKRVSLRVVLSPDSPPIQGDADLLRHLLINLILNASEASPEGEEVVVRVDRVGSDLKSGGEGLRMEIVDRGVGMSPGILDKIGSPFFTTKPDGTGLGLAICRKIARDHGGTMRIESKQGAGTAVALVFPTDLSKASSSLPAPDCRPERLR